MNPITEALQFIIDYLTFLIAAIAEILATLGL